MRNRKYCALVLFYHPCCVYVVCSAVRISSQETGIRWEETGVRSEETRTVTASGFA